MAENKGTWLDNATGKIVHSPPASGVQLISPNVEPTPDDEAAVERVKAALADDTERPAKTVTSKTTSK